MSYPWTIDSQNGTTPSTTGYLQIVSPNGLYLNSTTSGTNSNAIYMTGYVSGSPYSSTSTCYYYADRIYYYTVNPTLSTTTQTYFQSSDNGNRPNIYTLGTDIIISSDNGNGAIYLNANAGLWLNGVQITPGGGGGGISSIETLYNTMNIQNTSGPTTYVDINLIAGSGISISNQGSGNWQIDNTGGGGGGGDVYWSQLNNSNTTYNQLSSSNYEFGLTDNNSYPTDQETILLCNNGNFIGTFGTSYTAYLKVGDSSNGSTSGRYTLVANVADGANNLHCTMATINSNMHLFADKYSNTQYGQGRMYLYAQNVNPGNNGYQGSAQTFLGTSSEYWYEVNSLNYNNPSDIKLKENIISINDDYSINLVKKINPVSYTYKSDEKRKTHFGVIAQEIKEIIGHENLALHSNENDTQTICYTELIAPLIKTVQHLLQKVEDLEAAIKDLKK